MVEKSNRPRAAVVVLGDIGRSPRMCYHAHSLATRLNYDVTMVGYLDTLPHATIADNPNITFAALSPPPDRLSRLPENAQLPLKFLWTFLTLLWTLLMRVSFSLNLILMQNPPALPTMIVCWMVSRLKGAKFVIDWHNYMYSILQDKYGFENIGLNRVSEEGSADGVDPAPVKEPHNNRKKLSREDRFAIAPTLKKKTKTEKKPKKSMRRRYVELVYRWEGVFGSWADAGLCVTRAMREDLRHKWNVPSAVFYDRPPSWTFKEVSDSEKHELFLRLSSSAGGSVFGANLENDSTHFTSRDSSCVISWKEDRPLIVISSTSWTPDEDFSILLDAVVKYNESARLSRSQCPETHLPRLLLVITGRGPMKEFYLEKLGRMNLETIQVLTPWLEPEDYPRMLAAADIGVSLHTSTSALDLPMKVVDMFGSGLPVLAKKFACIGELVSEGENGRLFDTPTQLAHLLVELATGFPSHCKELLSLTSFVQSGCLSSWEENWDANARAILQPDVDMHRERIVASGPEPPSFVQDWDRTE